MPCLEITTMVGCPMRCTFCPQDKLTQSYGKSEKYLSLENFKIILAKVPTYVRIDFSGMAEPWSNPAATDMLEHTLESGYNITVYSTLQGMADYQRVIELLLAHGEQVETVVIHLPDESGNMRGFKSSNVYWAAREAFDNIGSQLQAYETMAMSPGWVGLTRAGNLDPRVESVETTPQHSTPLACSFTPFYDHNVLLPNGDVVLCCMDYSTKHRIGNLLIDDYFSLFRSEAMDHLREENMKYGHGDSLCKTCSRAKTYDLWYSGSNQFWEDGKTLVPVVPESVEEIVRAEDCY